MTEKDSGRFRTILIWAVLAGAIAVPLTLAATSPLLAYRDPIYIAAGGAGVVALALLLIQPLLAGGYLPGFPARNGRSIHRLVGAGLVLAVVVHVAGLWLTSPPDVIDALLLTSPTPFSIWGVVAMWAVFAAASVAALRRQFRFHPRMWRRIHTALATLIVLGSVVHAMLIVGTMETLSKAALCVLVIGATAKAISDLRVWATGPRGRP